MEVSHDRHNGVGISEAQPLDFGNGMLIHF